MKVPYSWLADWVHIPWGARELGSRLTMAGLELEALDLAAPAFTGVLVAEILRAERHPQADKLQVCQVLMGAGEPVQIVCGASNARAGLKTALATVAAQLPGDLTIKAARLRGVESCGMLASAQELGLAESSAGILELPPDAPVGHSLRDYLQLDDSVLELNVTANRGDALSIIGVAREVAALLGSKVTGPPIDSPAALSALPFPVAVDSPQGCPKFLGCVIRGVNNRAATPMWMRERLRRAGVRCISPVVDVTNYVLLELGQPMHAYDLDKLSGEVRVRQARPGEAITLLDGNTIQIQPDVLLIADREGPVGVAGIMGGQRTAVSDATTDVFLEVAYFAPDAIIGRARRWGMLTDASQRFERGVDPEGQARALNRALSLLVGIAGGSPGAVQLVQAPAYLPQRAPVPLRRARIERLLGIAFEDEQITQTLHALQMQVVTAPDGWRVTPPTYRFDVVIEADVIEEIARIRGYGAIAERDALVAHRFHSAAEERPEEQSLLEALAARGYFESISFAFVDASLQGRLFPEVAGLALANPIASDLSAMRVSLWPGLLRAALDNQRRQQDRIRLFEHGARFVPGAKSIQEIDSLAGVACGRRLPEQWGVATEGVDFFDVKADLESLLAATGAPEQFTFEPAALACLHPGRAARVLRQGRPVGWLGELHPSWVKHLDFTYAPLLFELDFAALAVQKPRYQEISRFPQVRRDLAIVVDETVTLSALAQRVTLSASSLLRDLRIFDVYRGPGVEAGRKSIALGLIFQEISRTLTDEDVERLIAAVVADLRVTLNARIRE